MSKKINYQKQGGNKRGYKNLAFVALVILFGLIIFAAVGQPPKLKEVPLSDVVNRANNGQIKVLTIKGTEVDVTAKYASVLCGPIAGKLALISL